MLYACDMEDKYKKTKSTVSFITYHFVFCPRYRRKIFLIPGMEERFKELVAITCANCSIEILSMECRVDHVYMCVSVLPVMTVSDIMKRVKGATSNKLKEEFLQLAAMPSLWTKGYFVSTEEAISDEIIQWYVAMQKTRP